jgi:drug/metabolite transporter (DMT)-like permease
MLWVAALASWLFLSLMVLITGEWRDWKALSKKVRAVALAMGLLNPTLYYLVLFAAYDRLPAQEAMAINYSWALTLALLAGPVLKQRIGTMQWLAAAVSYLGVLIIATRGDLLGLEFESPVGVLLAVSSTLIWSAYWLLNTRLTIPAVSGLWFNFTGGVLATSVLLAMTEPLSLPVQGVLGGAYVGVFEMGASFVLWLAAMRRSHNTLRTSSLIFLSPPISLLLIWWLVGEAISMATLAGLVFILAGLALQQRTGPGEPAAA